MKDSTRVMRTDKERLIELLMRARRLGGTPYAVILENVAEPGDAPLLPIAIGLVREARRARGRRNCRTERRDWTEAIELAHRRMIGDQAR